MYLSCTLARAADTCSERMRSTVTLNAGGAPTANGRVKLTAEPGGEPALDGPQLGLSVVGEPGCETRPSGAQLGVIVPDSGVPANTEGRCSASDAARRSRFVVPSALVLPERAEQTIATLCCERYSLYDDVKDWSEGTNCVAHGTISLAIFRANLPTLVPPYFWTSQGVMGSILF
jgi:hypothetical protein